MRNMLVTVFCFALATACVTVESDAGQGTAALSLEIGAGCGDSFVAFTSTEECPAYPIDLDCNAIQTLPEAEQVGAELGIHLLDGRDLPAETELTVWHVGAGGLVHIDDVLAEAREVDRAGGGSELCVDISFRDSVDGFVFEIPWTLTLRGDQVHVNNYVRFE